MRALEKFRRVDLTRGEAENFLSILIVVWSISAVCGLSALSYILLGMMISFFMICVRHDLISQTNERKRNHESH